MYSGKIEFSECHTWSDIEFAIEEAFKRIKDGNITGFDSNDTSFFSFEITGEEEDKTPILIQDGIQHLRQFLVAHYGSVVHALDSAGDESYVQEITEATNEVIATDEEDPDNDPDWKRVNEGIEAEWDRLCALYFQDGLRGAEFLSQAHIHP